MMWIQIDSTYPSNNWTLNEGESSARLKYHPESQSFRLHAANRRLYFMEKTGRLQPRFLIKTEYNVVIGEALRSRQAGTLKIGDEKFSYRINGNELQVIRKKEQLRP